MRIARFAFRVAFGLPLAISLVAATPPIAVAQFNNARSTSAFEPANSTAAGIRGASAQRPKNGPLLGGQQIRWPKMPFARSKPAANPPVNPSQPPVAQTAPYAAAQRQRSMPAGQPMGVAAQQRRQMMPRPSAVATTSVARGPAMPTRQWAESAPDNQNVGQVVDTVAQRPAAPQRMATIASSPAAVPQSPANGLLAQAHEWSQSARSEDDYSRIVDTCQRAATSQPDPAIAGYSNELASWALNRRGQLKAEAGRDAEAMADFDEAVKADSQRWRAVHNRGVLLAQAGEFKRAFDDFNRTIEINPQFAKAYSNRGALFVVAGKLAPALDDYARSIELDPTLAVAHRGRGRACHLVGQLDEAVSHYDEAVRLAPNDAYALASRADVLTDLGRYAEAAAQYDRAIEMDPTSSHAHSGSAWLLATCPDDAIRNSKLAIERAEKAIQLTNGADAACVDTLAAAQADAGDFPAAMKTVRQAVHLAAAEEREAFQERLMMYQQERPYRIAPVEQVIQASYEAGSGE